VEKLKYKYEKFVRALEALGRAISSFSRHDIPEDLKEHILTSIIKHYEMCYESGWKFLKLYLEKEYEIKLDSPKKVIRECYKLQIIDENTTNELFEIGDARNATVHDYDQENACMISQRISSYYDTLYRLNELILKNLTDFRLVTNK